MPSENAAEDEVGEAAVAVPAKTVDDQLIDELVSRAQAEDLRLTGEGGLLQQLTERLLESALEGEITHHLGCDKHGPAGRNGGNSRGRQTLQDRTDRRRSGGDRRAPRPGRLLRTEDRQEAAEAPDRHGRDGHLAGRERPDHR
ncbi:hypothetical protein GCM10010398_61340 [Streptomyces fimbriatus]